LTSKNESAKNATRGILFTIVKSKTAFKSRFKRKNKF